MRKAQSAESARSAIGAARVEMGVSGVVSIFRRRSSLNQLSTAFWVSRGVQRYLSSRVSLSSPAAQLLLDLAIGLDLLI